MNCMHELRPHRHADCCVAFHRAGRAGCSTARLPVGVGVMSGAGRTHYIVLCERTCETQPSTLFSGTWYSAAMGGSFCA